MKWLAVALIKVASLTMCVHLSKVLCECDYPLYFFGTVLSFTLDYTEHINTHTNLSLREND
jgi:hypothetical protein